MFWILKTHKEWPDSISSKSICPQKYRNRFSTKIIPSIFLQDMVPKRHRRVYGRRSRPLNSCASFWHRTSLYPWMRSNKSWAPWTFFHFFGTQDASHQEAYEESLSALSFVTLWLLLSCKKIQSTAISTAPLRQFQRVGCDQDWQTGSENGRWMAQATGTTRPGWITVVESMRLVGLLVRFEKLWKVDGSWFGEIQWWSFCWIFICIPGWWYM